MCRAGCLRVSERLSLYLSGLSPGFLCAVFTFANVLNYLDRGIVPGAFQSIGEFIRADLSLTSTDVQLGLLQSTYIVGYAIASVTFGHLVHYYPPFRLISVGLAIWCAAVILSGWAPHFWVLVLARVFSGAGEASFQCIVPPYIDDNAPPAKRGLWLSLFFAAIPVGTAVGYAYGGNVASKLSWRWAFYLEAIPMVPLVLLIWHLPYAKSAPSRGDAPGAEATMAARALARAAVAAGDEEAARIILTHSTPKSSGAGGSGGGAMSALILSRSAALGGGGVGVDGLAHLTMSQQAGLYVPPSSAAVSALGVTGSAGGSAGPALAALRAGRSASASRSVSFAATTVVVVGGGGMSKGGSAGAGGRRGLGGDTYDHLLGEEEGDTEGGDIVAASAGAGRTWEGGRTLFHSPVRDKGGDGTELPLALVAGGNGDSDANVDASAPPAAPPFFAELWGCITEPLYMSIVLGYAGYTAVLAGLGSFGPTIVQGLGLFSDQSSASLYFGGAVSLAGALGTPLGGWLLDSATRSKRRRIAKTDPLLAAHLGLVGVSTHSPGEVRALRSALGVAGELEGNTGPRGSIASASRRLLVTSESRGGGGAHSLNDSTAAAGAYAPLHDDGAPPPPLQLNKGSGAAVLTPLPASSAAAAAADLAVLDSEDIPDDPCNPFACDLKLSIAMPQASLLTVVGAVCCAGGVLMGSENGGLFFTLLIIGSLSLCATTAGVNQAIMASVRPESRSFAIGIATLITHALGDVPAPPIIGALADALSPQSCSGAGGTSDCTRSAAGLQMTLLLCTTWLVWPALLWACAWAITDARARERRAAAAAAAGHALGSPTRLASLLAALAGFTLYPRHLLATLDAIPVAVVRATEAALRTFRARTATGGSVEGGGAGGGFGLLGESEDATSSRGARAVSGGSWGSRGGGRPSVASDEGGVGGKVAATTSLLEAVSE